MSEAVGVAGLGDARFEFGRVVAQTFGLIGRNFVLFALLSLIFVGAPQFALLYIQGSLVAAGDPNLVLMVGLVGVLVTWVTTYVLQGALTRASVDDLSGRGVKFGPALGDGLRYFFPLFIVALLASLGIGLGFVLLVIPGILLSIRWIIAAPVTVVERDGPTHALGRSAELTKGRRWAVFALILLWLVFAYGAQFIAAIAVGAFAGADPLAATVTTDMTGIIVGIVTSVAAALVTLVSTVGTAVLYFELRRVKEGVGVDELASVFD